MTNKAAHSVSDLLNLNITSQSNHVRQKVGTSGTLNILTKGMRHCSEKHKKEI